MPFIDLCGFTQVAFGKALGFKLEAKPFLEEKDSVLWLSDFFKVFIFMLLQNVMFKNENPPFLHAEGHKTTKN